MPRLLHANHSVCTGTGCENEVHYWDNSDELVNLIEEAQQDESKRNTVIPTGSCPPSYLSRRRGKR